MYFGAQGLGVSPIVSPLMPAVPMGLPYPGKQSYGYLRQQRTALSGEGREWRPGFGTWLLVAGAVAGVLLLRPR